jgi:hypothetical protein
MSRWEAKKKRHAFLSNSFFPYLPSFPGSQLPKKYPSQGYVLPKRRKMGSCEAEKLRRKDKTSYQALFFLIFPGSQFPRFPAS